MQITSAKASKGSETCVSVKVSQFNDIVSMQYTMKWDPAILTFKEVKNFGLPGLEEANFGTKASWIKESLPILGSMPTYRASPNLMARTSTMSVLRPRGSRQYFLGGIC
ncbi:MAG: hypothetical protein R2788_24040 [Saprospiraceae bacterium]